MKKMLKMTLRHIVRRVKKNLTLIIGFALLSQTPLTAQGMGRIIFVKGKVDLISLRDGSRREAKVNTQIMSDEQIRTSHRSEVQVLLIDSTKVDIKPFSIVNIKPLQGVSNYRYVDQVPISVRMLAGKIRLKVPANVYSNKRRFFLKTPTLVAAVRGTEFACIATLDDARLAVFSGKVQVANRSEALNRAYILKERQETRVQAAQNPTAPKFLPDDILSNYLENYEINKEKKIKRRVREPESFIDRILRNQRRGR